MEKKNKNTKVFWNQTNGGLWKKSQTQATRTKKQMEICFMFFKKNITITWKIDTLTLTKLIFNKIKYWLKRHVMKHFTRKSQNGCSCNKHLHGFQEHLEMMTYNDFVGRLLNLMFQNLSLIPTSRGRWKSADRQAILLQNLHLPPEASATGHTQR